MATQRVHNVCYLIDEEYSLAHMQGKVQVATLPKGSVIISCGIEVLENSDATCFCLGINGDSEYYISKSSGKLDSTGYVGGKGNSKILKDTPIFLDLEGNATKGLIAVRILYFTPSSYMVEH